MNIKNILLFINMFCMSVALFSSSLVHALPNKSTSEENDDENKLVIQKKRATSKLRDEVRKYYLMEETGPNNSIQTKCQEPAPRPIASCIPDQRDKKNLKKWPYCVHGVIMATFSNNTRKQGSGTLVGPHLVLTCAHVLYDEDSKEKAIETSFYPDGKITPLSEKKAYKIYIPEEYEEYKNSFLTTNRGKEDYGLLVLEENIGDDKGYFGFSILEPNEIKQKYINVDGFPDKKKKGRKYCLWGAGSSPDAINDDYIISNKIRVSSGQSGSGAWYRVKDSRTSHYNYYVAGVVVSATPTQAYITKLTKERYDQIQDWINDSGIVKKYRKILPIKAINLQKAYTLKEEERENLYKIGGAEWSGNFLVKKLMNYSLSKLKILNLSSNFIGDKGMKSLGKGTFPQLEILNLANNNFGNKAIEYLSKAQFSKLKILNLAGKNDLSFRLNLKGIDKIHCPQLEELNLERNNFWEGYAMGGSLTAFTRAQWTHLKRLNLSYTQIRDRDVKTLMAGEWPVLEKLYLQHNSITDKGSEILSKALTKNQWTQQIKLNLTGNPIENRRKKALTRAPRTSLQTLGYAGAEKKRKHSEITNSKENSVEPPRKRAKRSTHSGCR